MAFVFNNSQIPNRVKKMRQIWGNWKLPENSNKQDKTLAPRTPSTVDRWLLVQISPDVRLSKQEHIWTQLLLSSPPSASVRRRALIFFQTERTCLRTDVAAGAAIHVPSLPLQKRPPMQHLPFLNTLRHFFLEFISSLNDCSCSEWHTAWLLTPTITSTTARNLISVTVATTLPTTLQHRKTAVTFSDVQCDFHHVTLALGSLSTEADKPAVQILVSRAQSPG